MAIYRQIHIDFWQDELVAEFSPEDKYFYLYLMTNNKTTQCGVYRVNLRVMAFDLGWDKTTVEKLIDRFIGYGRIKYNADHSEIFMVNWLKYNSARSPKVASLIDKQIKEIKTEEFKTDVITLCIEYGYPIKTVSQPEPEPTPTEEPTPTPEKNASESLSSIIQFMQENGYGMVTPHVIQELEYLVEDIEIGLLKEALKISVENNVRKLSYVKKIISNLETEGIITLEQYQAKETERSASRTQVASRNKADFFNEFAASMEGELQ